MLGSTGRSLSYNNIDAKISNFFEKNNVIKCQIEECDVDDICPITIKQKDDEIMLPNSLMAMTCTIMHSMGGHPGGQRLYNNVNKLYFVKDRGKLENCCKSLSANCLPCLASKPNIQGQRGHSDVNQIK